MKKIYEYHPETGELLAINNATLNPRKPGEYLARSNATFEPPPEVKENEIAVWTGVAWEVKPDWRGMVYYVRNAEGQIEAMTIDKIGETVPADSYPDIHDVQKTPEQILAAAIEKRDGMLAATDWYAIRASEPGGKPMPDDVLAYRQALRDIDKQPGWLANPDCPVLSV